MTTPAPIIVSTWSFSARGNDVAWPILASGGSALDAVEACCALVDAAPDVDSVGYGGLPDASGRVSLDGCVMLAPSRCGSACVLRRHLHPVSVARRVMERTDHVMLAGPDADDFADNEGIPAAEILSPEARAAWEAWRARPPMPVDQSRDRSLLALRPIDGGASTDGRLFGRGPSPHADPTGEERWKHHDTIGTLAIDKRGVMAGACSTSGMPFKMPGRVGDSPIIGHGLYVDPAVGGATATGAGELLIGVCGSFLAVEYMRQGKSPEEATRLVVERIRDSYELRPQDQVALIALRADGAWGAASLRPGFLAAARDDRGATLAPPATVVLPDEAVS